MEKSSLPRDHSYPCPAGDCWGRSASGLLPNQSPAGDRVASPVEPDNARSESLLPWSRPLHISA
eukprot:7258891-Pyramimonas_sp.AAC.1